MESTPVQQHNTVIINATNIGKRMSGIGVYALNLVKALTVQESEIQFLVYLNKNARKHFREFAFPENFQVRWVGKWLSPDYKFPGHLLRLLFANYLSLKHRKVLLFNTSQLVVNFFRRQQIITIHDVIPLLFKQYHKKQYPYFKYLMKFALRYASRIITPSQHTRKLLQEIYNIPGERIRVIYNGAPLNKESPGKIDNRLLTPYILYVGRICPMKNITALIEAFRLLQERIPHRLVIVGDGEEHIEKEIRSGRLPADVLTDERIMLLGYVENREMEALYRNASLFVFPSLYEGFGLPPLEAMAHDCPVVASFAASLPEVCGSAVYYVNPKNPDSMAEGMLRVLTDNALRQKLIRRGYARVRCFSWDTSAREHLKVIREMLWAEQLSLEVPSSAKQESKIRNLA